MEENDGMQRAPFLLPERIFAVAEEPRSQILQMSGSFWRISFVQVG